MGAGAGSWAAAGGATTTMPGGLFDMALVGGGCCCCLLAVSLLWAGRWRKEGAAGAGAGAGSIGAYADLVLHGLMAAMAPRSTSAAARPAARPRAVVADGRSAPAASIPASKADPRLAVPAAAAAAGSPPLPAAAAAAAAAGTAAAGAPGDAAAAPPVLKLRAVVPRHIAVIMDGNRRFGRERFADPLKGHEEGGRVRVAHV